MRFRAYAGARKKGKKGFYWLQRKQKRGVEELPLKKIKKNTKKAEKFSKKS